MSDRPKRKYTPNKFQVKNVELTAKVEELEKRLSDKDIDIKNISNELSDTKAKCLKLENDNKILQELLNDSYNTITLKDNQLNLNNRVIDDANDYRVNVLKELEETSKKCDEYKMEVDDVNDKYVLLKARYQDLNNMYDSTTHKLSELELKLSQKSEYVKSNSIEFDSVLNENNKLQNDIRLRNNNINSLKDTLAGKDEYIKFLLSKIMSLENLVKISNGGVPPSVLLECNENTIESNEESEITERNITIIPQANIQITNRNTLKVVRGLGKKR